MEAAAHNAKEFKDPPPVVMQVQSSKRKPCHRCGRNNHDQKDCKFREATCHNCGKTGHIAPVCRSAKKPQNSKKPTRPNKPRTKFVEVEHETADEANLSASEDLALFTVGTCSSTPIEVKVQINNQLLVMELDTGADVSIISEKTYESMFAQTELQPLHVPLLT